MGYPMTFQRLLNRNGLKEGDYGDAPRVLKAGVVEGASLLGEEATILVRAPFWVEALKRHEQWGANLAGDLRRLEKDARDEQSICHYIGTRTGIAPDVIAIVLKEFLDW